ncbi:unnamed protein product [Jaminaea pallidilutea]
MEASDFGLDDNREAAVPSLPMASNPGAFSSFAVRPGSLPAPATVLPAAISLALDPTSLLSSVVNGLQSTYSSPSVPLPTSSEDDIVGASLDNDASVPTSVLQPPIDASVAPGLDSEPLTATAASSQSPDEPFASVKGSQGANAPDPTLSVEGTPRGVTLLAVLVPVAAVVGALVLLSIAARIYSLWHRRKRCRGKGGRSMRVASASYHQIDPDRGRHAAEIGVVPDSAIRGMSSPEQSRRAGSPHALERYGSGKSHLSDRTYQHVHHRITPIRRDLTTVTEELDLSLQSNDKSWPLTPLPGQASGDFMSVPHNSFKSGQPSLVTDLDADCSRVSDSMAEIPVLRSKRVRPLQNTHDLSFARNIGSSEHSDVGLSTSIICSTPFQGAHSSSDRSLSLPFGPLQSPTPEGSVDAPITKGMNVLPPLCRAETTLVRSRGMGSDVEGPVIKRSRTVAAACGRTAGDQLEKRWRDSWVDLPHESIRQTLAGTSRHCKGPDCRAQTLGGQECAGYGEGTLPNPYDQCHDKEQHQGEDATSPDLQSDDADAFFGAFSPARVMSREEVGTGDAGHLATPFATPSSLLSSGSFRATATRPGVTDSNETLSSTASDAARSLARAEERGKNDLEAILRQAWQAR